MSATLRNIRTDVRNIDDVRKVLQDLANALESGAYTPSGAAGGDLTGTYPNPTIGTNKVDNTKLAQMATQTFKGRNTAGTGNPEDLSVTTATAMLNVYVGDSGAGGTKGLVKAPAAGDAAAKKYLFSDGTWRTVVESDVTNLVSDLAAKAPTSRLINTTAPITGGGDLTADRTIAISDATATVRGAVPNPPNDTTKFLRGDATWAVPGGGTVTSVTGTAPIASSGGATPAISIGAFGATQLQISGNTSLVFNASGSWTCPAGVTVVQAECWGGGGGGGGGNNMTFGGGGGGGGAYSKSTGLTVVPGTSYTITVGGGGGGGALTVNGTSGGDSWFSTSGTILAKGGAFGLAGGTGTGGTGGASGSGVGGTKFSGGNGTFGNPNANGGGAGSSAGTAAGGNNPSPAGSNLGAAAPTGGAAGGNGGASGSNPGTTGGVPGGGGGGAASLGIGGAGAAGQVVLTFAADTLTLTTLGGGSSPTLSFPPVTGNVITDQDSKTVTNAMLAGSIDLAAKLTLTETSVTTTATLVISTSNVCSGTSADYTATLPAVSGNSGKLVQVRIDPACTKLVTIKGNAAELIDGVNSRVMWANESALLYCNGTNWTKIAGKSIAMACQMVLSASSTIANSTTTKVAVDTILTSQDASASGMGDTTNHRINIKRDGKYEVLGSVYWATPGANTSRMIVIVSKNVGVVTVIQSEVAALAASVPNSFGGGVASFSAGDYLELNGFQNSGGGVGQTFSTTAVFTGLAAKEIPSW